MAPDSFDKKIFKRNINTGNKSIEPIFIVGMPRSGTTLVEQIISSHSDVSGLGEINFLKCVKKYCGIQIIYLVVFCIALKSLLYRMFTAPMKQEYKSLVSLIHI